MGQVDGGVRLEGIGIPFRFIFESWIFMVTFPVELGGGRRAISWATCPHPPSIRYSRKTCYPTKRALLDLNSSVVKKQKPLSIHSHLC